MNVVTRVAVASALLSCAFGSGCAGSTPESKCADTVAVEAELPPGEPQLAARAAEIAWSACPPSLPPDCEMAILEGDPKRKMLFTVRFRVDGSFELTPHRHPGNERVTVLEGRIGVGFGDEVDRDAVTWFGPGDYYVNAKGEVHFVLAEGPTVVQITGIGPWEANLIDP